MDKVIVITGPTAVGKTKLSIAVAKHFKTDIINSDAYQIYKKMNIGTAKPSEYEKDNIVHHLMDFLDPSLEYSVADYQKDVRHEISKLLSENKLPLLVGGTGLYIDSVIKDYRFLEEKRKEDDAFLKLSNEELHQMLEKIDHDSSLKIHKNNRKRLLRAIELANSSITKDSRSKNHDFVYDALVIFLNDDRTKLYERINKRVDAMIENGLIDEVKNIGESNFSKTSKVAIGYKEVISYLNNEIDYNEMVELIKKNSRHYAKRQLTWFKNKVSSKVVEIDTNNFDNTINYVIDLIEEHLGK